MKASLTIPPQLVAVFSKRVELPVGVPRNFRQAEHLRSIADALDRVEPRPGIDGPPIKIRRMAFRTGPGS